MRKHKHYAIFHKAGNRRPAPFEIHGRRAHGLASNIQPLTPKQMQLVELRHGIYLNSSPAHRNAVATSLAEKKRRMDKAHA